MNPNKRHSNTTAKDVLRARLMLQAGMIGIDVAAVTGFSAQAVSGLKNNTRWNDVQIPVIRTTHADPKPGQPWNLRIEKKPAMVTGHCAGCGKMLFDGLDELIYLVAEDKYACDQKCLDFVKES
jgi:hypothetical protein